METPERIYISQDIENRTWLMGKGDTSFIEYIRKDVFIKKVEKWIKETFSETDMNDLKKMLES